MCGGGFVPRAEITFRTGANYLVRLGRSKTFRTSGGSAAAILSNAYEWALIPAARSNYDAGAFQSVTKNDKDETPRCHSSLFRYSVSRPGPA
jgi:hypothetical protein